MSKSRKVHVGIDWANTGIQKPTLKPDPQHPFFKPDPSGATDSPPLPRIKSSVATRGSHWQHSHSTGCRTTTPASQGAPQENKEYKGDNKVSGLGLAKFPGDLEKREVKDKSYDWIMRRMDRLDPKGYVEEIYSFRHFGRNSKSFTLEIIAIADWGRKYMELRFNYPIPVFPNYLFNWFSESCQVVGQAPKKPDSLQQYGDDIWGRCTEAWTLMVSILQFWTNKESVKDGEIFGGWVRLVSALAKYVMETINPHLEESHRVMWEKVVHWTPWMKK